MKSKKGERKEIMRSNALPHFLFSTSFRVRTHLSAEIPNPYYIYRDRSAPDIDSIDCVRGRFGQKKPPACGECHERAGAMAGDSLNRE